MAAKLLLSPLILAGLLATTPIAHAEVTADQAQTLETSLRDWLASLVRPALDVGTHPVQVAPEGDQFRITLAAPDVLATAGILAPGLAVSVGARPMEGGRWALEDLRIPSPLRITVPANAVPGKDEKPRTFEASASSMTFHGVFDPSYATTSSFDTGFTNLRTVTSNSVTNVGRSTGHTIWQPAPDGHINFISESNSEAVDTQVTTPGDDSFSYTARKSHSTLNVHNAAPASLATLVRSISAILPTLQGKQDELTQAQRALARKIVYALRDLQGGTEFEQSMDGIKFETAGHSATLRHGSIGSSFGTPDGNLSLSISMQLEGIDSPDVPPGLLHDYLPRKLSFKPRISGIPSADVTKLLLRAIDSTAQELPALQNDATALLGAGPLEVAIDELELNLGAATVSATGSVEVSSPTNITAEAEITATGLNALMKRANTAPELKDIAPVLIFLKGIGKQDGDETTWSLNYEDGKFTVNDTDLSALVPSGKGK